MPIVPSAAPPQSGPTGPSPLQHVLELARANRKADAVRVLRELLAQNPGQIAARCLLAVMLQELGDNQGALAELDQAAAMAPQDATIHDTRAGVLLALVRPAEAERAARMALNIDTRRPRAWLSLGLALDAQGKADQTIAALRTALDLRPDQPLARRVLVRWLLRNGDSEFALQVARHGSVLAEEPCAQEIVGDFCAAHATRQTIVLLEKLLLLHPQNYTFIICMARSLHQMGRSSTALRWSEQARQLRPLDIEPAEMQAVTLIDRGEVEQGLEIYRELLARPDASEESASRHLILMHYDPAENNDTLFRAHSEWARTYVRGDAAPWRARHAREPDKRLRIGWISPRFGAGPVASFLTGLLGAFERRDFDHCLISLRRNDDESSTRWRELADEWQPLHDLDDTALLQRLRACDLDIAIDLAGHSFGNRLRVIAQRVAPIQLCWLDYFDTTAVDTMDGWISDRWLTPEDSSQGYTERLLRLASGRFCYTPPPQAPQPERIGAGPPTFASFNRLAKLNDRVLAAWSRILLQVPGSTLQLGANLLDDDIARTVTLQRFARHGVAAERLQLHPKRSYAELLEAYRHVDFALDPFPFSGCTTTCDALWMGVPVIARRGSTFVASQSASLLQRMGRDDWVADDDDSYVERVVTAVTHLDAVRAGRRELRESTRKYLCDAPAQALDFASLLRNIWREYCAGA
jgi:protein O-GlcNAc transferase